MKVYGALRYSSTNSKPRHCFEVNSEVHVPAALTPMKESQYAQDRRLSGPYGCLTFVAKMKGLTLSEIENQSSSPYPITLYWDSSGSTLYNQ